MSSAMRDWLTELFEEYEQSVTAEMFEEIVDALEHEKKRGDGMLADARLAREVDGWVSTNTNFSGEPPYAGNKGIMLALAELKERADKAEAELKAWNELVTVAHVDRDKLWPNNWPQNVAWIAHCLHSKSIPPTDSK